MDPRDNTAKTPPIPQSITEINTLLDKALSGKTGQKQGRVYLHIDTRSNLVGLTSDKKRASSRREVIAWMHRISEHPLQAEDKENPKQILSLRKKITALTDRLNKEAGLNFFEKIAKRISNFVFKTGSLTKMTKENLENKKRDVHIKHHPAPEAIQNLQPDAPAKYGTKPNVQKILVSDTGVRSETTIIKTIDYAKHSEEQLKLKKMEESDVDHFDKLKDSPHLEMQDILLAIDNELFKELNPKWTKEKAAIHLVTGIFEDILDKISEQIEQLPPEKALEKLEIELQTEIQNKNKVVIELDRSTFKDLLGKRVDDGLGNKAPDDIDVNSAAVRKLIKEYSDGSWTPSQQKILAYDMMDERHMNKMNATLRKIFASPFFQATLINYFTQIKSNSY